MTEERVIPGKTNIINVCKHIARYNFALPYCEDKRVLDAACGSGYGSWLISQVANEVVAIDIDEGTIRQAVEKYPRSNVGYYQSDILGMPDFDRFDAIVSFETVEHIKDLALLETVIWRNLTDHGVFVFSVPLNEKVGQNEFHEHVFTLESAQMIFPHFQIERSFVQEGVNFYQPDVIDPQPFQYFVAICTKRPDFRLEAPQS